jgi:hypothetical protein
MGGLCDYKATPLLSDEEVLVALAEAAKARQ